MSLRRFAQSHFSSKAFLFFLGGVVAAGLSAQPLIHQGRNPVKGVSLEREIQSILDSREFGRGVGLYPWAPGSSEVSVLVISLILERTSLGEILEILKELLERTPQFQGRERANIQSWLSELMEVEQENRVEGPFDAEESVRLQRARHRLALGHGWFRAGDSERAMANLLAALSLVRETSAIMAEESELLEIELIAGTVLLMVFNRPELLIRLRDLEHSSVWSFRAGRALARDFHP